MKAIVTLTLTLTGLGIMGLLGVLVYQNARAHAAPPLTTSYCGVLMTSGQAYFGRLEALGSAYPVLHDVYYVRSQVNPETKQVTNSLVKRGQEWHAPDRMILNAAHIVLIEPVKPDSQMGKLIEENRKASAGAQK